MGVCFLSSNGRVFAKEITVYGSPTHTAVQAKIAVKDTSYEWEKELVIKAEGLRALGVYTVWLISEESSQSMKGVGKFPYDFQADSSGQAVYRVRVDTADLQKESFLRVVLHKDGDARNLDKTNVLTTFTVRISDLTEAARPRNLKIYCDIR